MLVSAVTRASRSAASSSSPGILQPLGDPRQAAGGGDVLGIARERCAVDLDRGALVGRFQHLGQPGVMERGESSVLLERAELGVDVR